MKLEGYLVTAETFKLKTIFKHPRKHHHVIFYARDADDRDDEVLLNNNNAIAVTPGGCDLPFRSVVMSHHGQITNKGKRIITFSVWGSGLIENENEPSV